MNNMESSSAQANLRFSLPLTAGQSIVVLGHAPALAEALTNSGLLSMMFCPETLRAQDSEKYELSRHTTAKHEPLPFRTSSVDHIIIPELTQDIAGWIPGEVLRILKRRGTVSMGFANKTSLGGWRSRWQHGKSGLEALSGSSIGRWLGDRGLQLISRYGIWTNLQQPKYLVPLHHEHPTNYFFSHLFIPYSWPAAIVRPVVSVAARLGWQQSLFPYLFVIARSS